MIQRVQSIFIIIAALVMASLIVWPIDTFGSARGMVELRWDGVFDVTPGTEVPVIRRMLSLAFVVVVPIILNAVSLFLFKRRPLQMRLAGVAAGFEVCLTAVLVYLSIETARGMEADAHFCVRWLLPLAAAVLDILAYRRISDDEALVRSLDRLR